MSLWSAVRSYFVASLYGLLLPMTVGGDAVRVLALRRVGMVEIATSIIVERSIGVVAMGTITVFCVSLLAGSVVDSQVQVSALLIALATVGVVGLFGASLYAAGHWARRITANGPLAVLRRSARAYGRYREHAGVLLVFYVLSVAESLIPAFTVYVIANGLGLGLPLVLLLATVPLAMAAARIPVALGFGVHEASFVVLAGLVGISSTNALSIMLLLDLVMLLAVSPCLLDGRTMALRHELR